MIELKQMFLRTYVSVKPREDAATMQGRFTVAACIVISCAVAFALVGCAGNQTGFDAPAVDGAFGNAGNTIALRNVLIPNPQTPREAYPAGSTVPVLLAIVNQGNKADKLVAVTSPAASQVQLTGITDIPPGDTVISTVSSAPINAPATSPLVVGRLQIMLTLNRVLRAGLNIPLTFGFQHAGAVTLWVPTGARSDVISSG
jgi:copper(I)-binding protein